MREKKVVRDEVKERATPYINEFKGVIKYLESLCQDDPENRAFILMAYDTANGEVGQNLTTAVGQGGLLVKMLENFAEDKETVKLLEEALKRVMARKMMEKLTGALFNNEDDED